MYLSRQYSGSAEAKHWLNHLCYRQDTQRDREERREARILKEGGGGRRDGKKDRAKAITSTIPL